MISNILKTSPVLPMSFPQLTKSCHLFNSSSHYKTSGANEIIFIGSTSSTPAGVL